MNERMFAVSQFVGPDSCREIYLTMRRSHHPDHILIKFANKLREKTTPPTVSGGFDATRHVMVQPATVCKRCNTGLGAVGMSNNMRVIIRL
jgi:hypothetical protein